MASELKYWIGATLALCLIIGVGAVSGGPDLAPPSEQITQGPGTRWAGEAAGFAVQWRKTWVRWRLESYRARMSHAADSARAAGGTAPVLLVDGPSTPEQLVELQKDLAEIWHAAAPEGFKVAVALVIVRSGAAKPGPDTPPLSGDEASTYLFPDSLHRDMCLAVIHESYTGRLFFDASRTREVRGTEMLRWLAQGLGPCAFYGAYGVPGREIGRWMRSGGMDFAIYPRWWTSSSDPWLRMFYYSYSEGPPSRQPADWWVSLYSFLPWDGVSCYGGRVPQCARNVFDSGAIADSQPNQWDESQWHRGQSFFAGVSYLSDLAQRLGPARFSDFWDADVPMDSALHQATGKPLGDWTLTWARSSGPTLHLGPSAPPLDVIWAVLPALLALGASVWYAGRRQIG